MVEILQPDRSNFICISKIYITRHEFQFQASSFRRLIIFQRLLFSFILITRSKYCQFHFIVRFLKNKYRIEISWKEWLRSCNQIDQIFYVYRKIYIIRHEFQFQVSSFSRLIILQRLLLSFILTTRFLEVNTVNIILLYYFYIKNLHYSS